ncbi:hypothetical protein DFJ77DRAFT_475154 [Powellomyces hirtus]|nr:hypothetical protein DFJ77DRAFT_475154 [Powellomyces hirtus]
MRARVRLGKNRAVISRLFSNCNTSMSSLDDLLAISAQLGFAAPSAAAPPTAPFSSHASSSLLSLLSSLDDTHRQQLVADKAVREANARNAHFAVPLDKLQDVKMHFGRIETAMEGLAQRVCKEGEGEAVEVPLEAQPAFAELVTAMQKTTPQLVAHQDRVDWCIKGGIQRGVKEEMDPAFVALRARVRDLETLLEDVKAARAS